MNDTFKQFLKESVSEEMMNRMADEVQIIDKDMGNVFVVRDIKLGGLTSNEHTFDVRFHRGGVEVIPHNPNDSQRAVAIKKHILGESRGNIPDIFMTDEQKAEKKKGIEKGHKLARDRYHKQLEDQHGPDWKAKVKAERDAADAKLDAISKKNGNSWAGYAEDRAKGNQTSKDGWTGD